MEFVCWRRLRHLIGVFTARKRSLRKLCFYTCLPFCSQEGCLSQCMLGYTPLGADTPWSRHYPGADTPQSRHPRGPDIPPCAVHAGRYGQQAGGTHPTGMHTCSQMFSLNIAEFSDKNICH